MYLNIDSYAANFRIITEMDSNKSIAQIKRIVSSYKYSLNLEIPGFFVVATDVGCIMKAL